MLLLVLCFGMFFPNMSSTPSSTHGSNNVKLIKNHSRDQDVQVMWSAEDVLFEYKPVTLPGMEWPKAGYLEFGTDIVKLGADSNGNIISFICPQKTLTLANPLLNGTVESEVEIGEIGGKIDTQTGKGVIYIDDLAWKYWGDFAVGGNPVSLTKDDAAFIPIESANSEGMLVLNSIDKSAHAGGKIDDVFTSYLVSGVQGDPQGIQKGLVQSVVIDALNVLMPGFPYDGTKIQWNIDLKSPQKVSGSDYQKMAQSLHMGTHSH